MMRRGLGVLALLVVAATGVLPTPAAATPEAPAQTTGDPAFRVDVATLDAALDCDPFTHPDREPVLLVHGTFTGGHEQWDWNYALRLRATGHDVCIITYPDRGFGDMQISAEYIARAVQRIAAESGRQVDMVGHSQGAYMPRWAIKYWPSVQAALDDFVLLAGPSHGTTVAPGGAGLPTGQPAAFFQFAPTSAFATAINSGDETPGDIDYTSIYTLTDELVQPVNPPTAALDRGLDNPRVSNILIQDLCPLRVVDHVTIGTTDVVAMNLTLDALDHDGPAQAARLNLDPILCNLPDQYLVPESFLALLAQPPISAAGGLPALDLVTSEPPLPAYAITPVAASPAVPVASSPAAPAPDAAAVAANTAAPDRTTGGATLPSTGQAIPILAALIAIAVALVLRAGRSRLDDEDDDDPGV